MSAGQQSVGCNSAGEEPDAGEQKYNPQDPHSELPINAALFRGIDLSEFDAFVEEEYLHVVEKEFVRVRIGHVQSKVIDQLILLLQPLFPAIPTDLRPDPLTQIRRDRRVTERLILLPAPGTLKFIAKQTHSADFTTEDTEGTETTGGEDYFSGTL